MIKKLLLLVSIIICLTGCWEKSKGVKIGTIVKCANEGLIVDTYECEMIRGGMTDGSGVFGKSFHFTVEDKRLIPIAESALNGQKNVKLSYHQELFAALWRTAELTNAFADNIEIIE